MSSRTYKTGLVAAASLIVGGLAPAASWGSPAASETADVSQTTPTRSSQTNSSAAASSQTSSSSGASSQTTPNAGPQPATQFGINVPGDSFKGKQQTYGRLGVARMFFPGLPQQWSGIESKVGDTGLVVSFRAAPSEILSGRHDAQLRRWFAEAPRDHVTRWSYMHEPEDDIERGRLQAAQYRSAWQHVARLADSADNPALRSTLILMCWTVHEHSRRDWRDYYPGDSAIDLLAFDCYSSFGGGERYREPARLFGPAYEVAQQLDKPFGIAEIGSNRINGDDGSGRAQWLQRSAEWLRQHDARFVSYFDNGGMKLDDSASVSAWRNIVASQWN